MTRFSKLLSKDLNIHLNRRFSQTSCENAKPYEAVPGPRSLPIIGTNWLPLLPDFHRALPQFYTKLAKKYGPLYKYRVGGTNYVVVSDPDDVKAVFGAEGEFPEVPFMTTIHRVYRNKIRPDLFPSAGINGSPGPDWWEFRKKVQPEFLKVDAATFYIKDIREETEKLAIKAGGMLDEKGELPDNFSQWLRYWSMELRGRTMLDIKFGTLELDQDVSPAVKKFVDQQLLVDANIIWVFFTLPLWSRGIKTRSFRLFDECMEDLIKFGWDCAEKTRTKLKKKLASGVDAKDLSVFERLHLKLGVDSPEPAVVAVDSLSVGVNLTSTQAGFVLYCLAVNPEVQEKAYEEIMRVVGPGQPVEVNHINQLRYVNGIHKETARVLPVFYATLREIHQDVVLSGYTVPKGTVAQLLHYGMGKLRYPDADKFAPERWISGSSLYGQHHPFSWIFFGHGRRTCLGKRFAILELQIFIVEFVRRYKMEWHYPELKTHSVGGHNPARPLNIKLIPRT